MVETLFSLPINKVISKSLFTEAVERTEGVTIEMPIEDLSEKKFLNIFYICFYNSYTA